MEVYLSGSSEAEGEKFKPFTKGFVTILGLRFCHLKIAWNCFVVYIRESWNGLSGKGF